MSRSKRKTFRGAIACLKPGAQKWWKRFAAKTLRQATRHWLRGDKEVPGPRAKEVADIWGSPADGKRWHRNSTEKDLRQ